MILSEALQNKKKKILSLWVERTLDSYISSGFFKQSHDQIANPTGANIKDGLTRILDTLLEESESQDYSSALDQIIRIRAVQDFSPSQAVVPFLELKWIVRQILADDAKTKSLVHDLAPLECEIDRIALAAFDMYTQCREQLYQVRIRELKSGSHILTDTPCSSKLLRKSGKGAEKIN